MVKKMDVGGSQGLWPARTARSRRPGGPNGTARGPNAAASAERRLLRGLSTDHMYAAPNNIGHLGRADAERRSGVAYVTPHVDFA